jgi:Fe-Mn family superoxide dismutase
MAFEPKNYDRLLGTAGFSDQLLKNHFTLYQGYVTNVNKLVADLASSATQGWMGTPGYAEMKRRFGWEFDGMRLHELYFDNLTKDITKLDQKSSLYKKLEASFGSFENWEKDFRATAAMRGIGWVVLYLDQESDRLFNVWINEHDTGHFAGCKPILVMDVFEHAFMLDYGTKRADYIEAFMKAINWPVVEKRV